ncbi:class A beta-lactamase [Streptomyces sp. NPDC006798]|uniref:class A beta-lactamase n=1 Tax=Streptomyces sp. NPDC006798 TaxID=3155462 RepID=UPI00340DA9BE
MTGHPLSRRDLSRRGALAAVAGLAAVPLVGCDADTSPAPGRKAPPGGTPASGPAATASGPAAGATGSAFTALERRFGAVLGVYAIDTGSGRTVAHRPDERFAYASTCKALIAGAVLKRNTLRQMERRIVFGPEVIEPHSPITEPRVGKGMSLRELCDATVRYSDNAAANILFDELGGPAGLQRALRAIGDRVTRCDRYETELSDAVPGDLRDTSTARALTADLRAYALGNVLPADRRAVLVDWLKRNTTGDALIRAGAPAGWTVGDKTGSGGYGTRNDIGIAWPPGRAPIVLSVLSKKDVEDAKREDALIAEAAEVALGAFV